MALSVLPLPFSCCFPFANDIFACCVCVPRRRMRKNYAFLSLSLSAEYAAITPHWAFHLLSFYFHSRLMCLGYQCEREKWLKRAKIGKNQTHVCMLHSIRARDWVTIDLRHNIVTNSNLKRLRATFIRGRECEANVCGGGDGGGGSGVAVDGSSQLCRHMTIDVKCEVKRKVL